MSNLGNTGQSTNLGRDGKITSPLSYRIEYCRLYPNEKVNPLDKPYMELNEIVKAVHIEEGLEMQSILVSLKLGDASNTLEFLRITGNEKIELLITQDILEREKKEIELELYISDIINYSKPAIAQQSYEIQCVAKHAYLNQLEMVNEPFDNSIGKSIEGICQSHLDVEDVTIDSQGGRAKGIIPNLRPLAACNWLARNALENGQPHYFWDSVKNGLRFSSWEELTKQEPIIKLNNQPFFEGIAKDSAENYDIELKKVRKVSSELNLSKFNDAPAGAYASTLMSVDIAKKKVEIKKSENVELIMLNEHKPFPEKDEKFGDSLDKKKNAKKFFINQNSLAFEGQDNYHAAEKDNIQKAIMQIANQNYMTHTLDCSGNPDLFAGAVVELDFWKSGAPELLEGAEKEEDELMSGKYIITNAVHVFALDYSTTITIKKDSSKFSFDEKGKI